MTGVPVDSDELQEIQNAREPLPDEIPAANVRSSLAELEVQASQVLNRLEYIKTTQEQQQPTNPMFQQMPIAPGYLQSDRKPTAEVLSSLENLISQLDLDDEPEFVLPPLDESSQLAVITHSITAYLSALERQHLNRVVSKIVSDTNRWLSHMFRFMDCSTGYYRESAECILNALRLAIANRFSESTENRLTQLQNATLYISEVSSLFALQHTCRFIGLPVSNIRVVPCHTMFGARGIMDASELQKIIATDVEAGKFPLFIIADLGSSVCGDVDNLALIKNVCNLNNIWLHCQGHCLAALAVTKGTLSGVNMKSIPDSITINFGNWLGITGVPCVLLYRHIPVSALTMYDVDPILSNRLFAVSLWTIMQTMGANSISDRIFMAFDSCRQVHEILSRIEGIRILSKAPRHEAGKSFRALLNNPISYNTLFETAVPVVVFQFDGRSVNEEHNENDNGSVTSPHDESTLNVNGSGVEAQKIDGVTKSTNDVIGKTIEKISNSSYFDRLNGWLGQILLRDCAQLNLEIINHPVYGTCIRYSPFAPGYGELLPLNEVIENVAQFIEAQIEILTATVKHRNRFNKLVEESPVLRLIELNDWAGLGSVHYVPEGWETLLTDQAKTELNRLNTALVEMLKAHDGAFSLGEGSDGLICVRFGMVTSETDVEELLDLVIQTGQKIQENSKILDTMSEILKKGIEAATIDLQREADEKLWQDGILRQVPLVGRVVNWWSPPAKEGGVKGRSLNLTQGVVESTENIYKYHMQMTAKANQLPGNKNPPTPLVQTPISADSKSLHSRNASSSSQQSSGTIDKTIPQQQQQGQHTTETTVS
ncbi:pyridoxal-dependent decarboxylase domain-containing protein 1 [Toxorhynchites rutilus septentrionalis]|uniref:pyridoxal-dependent decarboxylase domain-containing protein 1 n=1 Tax=Toxorhynchites rutilus septentrionalis TaxID=329112 RepID=UPI0024790C82|nr:pyridoxal-dependent decarboxylase domain-containing protein 1 [Toxorhynchites rutilus septentrionalis]